MAPGGVLGAWQQLQSEMDSPPSLTAATQVSTFMIQEDVLETAMLMDDNVHSNLWWWHAARGAFYLLREREPFAGWASSKLWAWLSTGTHIRVPRDHGELVGADSPFVILVHGSCRAVPNTYVSPQGETGSKKERRGTGMSTLLPLRSSCAGRGTTAAAEAKRVFSGPDLIIASTDNTYLFKHDSLVFVPSRESASWLPPSWSFTPAKTTLGAAKDIPPPPAAAYRTVEGDAESITPQQGSPQLGAADHLSA